jgi:LysM repeat protein
MTGTLAAGVGVTSAIPTSASAAPAPPVADDNRVQKVKASLSEFIAQAFVPLSQQVVKTVAPHVPDTYQVRAGDTITSVSEHFGIPTPLLLSLNGLSWNSILHEGQVVRLTATPSKQRGMAPPRVSSNQYEVEPGDSLTSIAERLGMSVEALAAANDLDPVGQVTPGDVLTLPGTQADLAPRVIPVSAEKKTPAVVFASSTRPTESSADEPTSAEQESPSEADQDASEEEAAADAPNPLAAEILEAPELRPKPKPKAAPAPPPPPPPAPVEDKKEDPDDDDDDDDDESSETVERTPVEGAVTPLNDVRRSNATVIVNVGRDLGVPDYGIVIALATAMQESSLRNIDWGDRDSVGLFQQRPSTGWGSAEQIMDPMFASKAFYGGPSNPNPGRTRGLLDYSGWQSMDLTDAAQKVQRSAYPEAYAKWEASAWAWLEELS